MFNDKIIEDWILQFSYPVAAGYAYQNEHSERIIFKNIKTPPLNNSASGPQVCNSWTVT